MFNSTAALNKELCVLPSPNNLCAPSERCERSLNWVENLDTFTPLVD